VRVALPAEQLLYHSPGGIGRYTAQLLTGLGEGVLPVVAHHSRAEIVEAYARAGVPPELLARTAVSYLPRPLLYQAWVAGPGWPPLKTVGPPDLVHAPSIAVPPKGKVPLVVTVHDAAPQLFPGAFPARSRRFMIRAMAAVARRADLVITVSDTAAGEIAEHSPIRPDRIRVVPNGVSPPAVDSSDMQAVLRRYGLAGRRYVLWVGSLEPRKGVATLVGAMAQLRRRHPGLDVETVLAGYQGWLGGVAGRDIRRLGRLGETDLWCVYRGAAVFAFPSRHEGFGLPVLEAMSQGVPVVASDIPVLREVAGDAALFAPPGDIERWADAIFSLLDDGAMARCMGDAGRRRSGPYSIEAMLKATRAVYIEAGAR
jgi:glycosyltransferase involved in cell wall biosynthesis